VIRQFVKNPKWKSWAYIGFMPYHHAQETHNIIQAKMVHALCFYVKSFGKEYF